MGSIGPIRETSGSASVDVATVQDAELVAFRNRHVGFVFQFHHLLPEFTAAENAEMPLRIARVDTVTRRPRAGTLLTRVGFGERLDHRPGMLSGGEQQRVAVARALSCSPPCSLPTNPRATSTKTTADALARPLREMHAEFGTHGYHCHAQPSLGAAVRPHSSTRSRTAATRMSIRPAIGLESRGIG